MFSSCGPAFFFFLLANTRSFFFFKYLFSFLSPWNVKQTFLLKINIYLFLHNLHRIHDTHKYRKWPCGTSQTWLRGDFLFYTVYTDWLPFVWKLHCMNLTSLQENLLLVVQVHGVGYCTIKMSSASPRHSEGSSGLLSSGSEPFGFCWADPEPPHCR